MDNVFIALENVRSLHNVGALFRTCSFFGFRKVLLVGYTGKDVNNKLHSKVSRSSLGSENDLEITFLDSSKKLLEFTKSKNLKLVCIEQSSKSVAIEDWTPTENMLVVFGNEVEGVSNELLENCNEVVEIRKPGMGVHNSLNITTSAGIVLNHLSQYHSGTLSIR